MQKKGLRIVNWRLWRPAASLMRRLRFPGKMALISLAFLLPVVWLLGNFVLREQQDLAFVASERHGVAYAQGVYRVLEATDQWRLQARSRAFGGDPAPVDAARQRFDQALAALRELQAVHGASWNLKAEWERIDQALAQVSGQNQGNPAQVYQAMTALSRSVAELLARVTDESGLALDPELPSYYLMSATLMRGPDVIRRTGELRGLAGGALRAGRIELAQAAKLAELRSMILADLAKARGDLEKVQGAEPEWAARLSLEAPKTTAAFINLVDLQFPAGAMLVQGDAGRLIERANQTLTAQYAQVTCWRRPKTEPLLRVVPTQN